MADLRHELCLPQMPLASNPYWRRRYGTCSVRNLHVGNSRHKLGTRFSSPAMRESNIKPSPDRLRTTIKDLEAGLLPLTKEDMLALGLRVHFGHALKLRHRFLGCRTLVRLLLVSSSTVAYHFSILQASWTVPSCSVPIPALFCMDRGRTWAFMGPGKAKQDEV